MLYIIATHCLIIINIVCVRLSHSIKDYLLTYLRTSTDTITDSVNAKRMGDVLQDACFLPVDLV